MNKSNYKLIAIALITITVLSNSDINTSNNIALPKESVNKHTAVFQSTESEGIVKSNNLTSNELIKNANEHVIVDADQDREKIIIDDNEQKTFDNINEQKTETDINEQIVDNTRYQNDNSRINGVNELNINNIKMSVEQKQEEKEEINEIKVDEDSRNRIEFTNDALKSKNKEFKAEDVSLPVKNDVKEIEILPNMTKNPYLIFNSTNQIDAGLNYTKDIDGIKNIADKPRIVKNPIIKHDILKNDIKKLNSIEKPVQKHKDISIHIEHPKAIQKPKVNSIVSTTKSQDESKRSYSQIGINKSTIEKSDKALLSSTKLSPVKTKIQNSENITKVEPKNKVQYKPIRVQSGKLVSKNKVKVQQNKILQKPNALPVQEYNYFSQFKQFFPKVNTVNNLIVPESLKLIFGPYDIKDLENQKRILAAKALTDFLLFYWDDFKPIKTYMYLRQCSLEDPKFVRKTEELTDLNYKMYLDLVSQYELFSNLYIDWSYKCRPEYATKQDYNMDEESVLKIKDNILSFKSRFEKFFASYKKTTAELLPSLQKLECGIKDTMIFYTTISRFHKAYKVAGKDSVTQRIYANLWIDRTLWTKEINTFIRRFSFMQLWVSLFNEFLYYSESEASPEYMVKMQKAMIHFREAISYTQRILKTTTTQIAEVHKNVNTKVARLEEHCKIPKKPFINVDTIY